MILPQILTTKLYPPPPRASLVSRPRLVERLNAGLKAGHRLSLISAPAGFGKTTLASEWLLAGQLASAVAWISLDEADNDSTRFLFYLIAALQQVDAQIGGNVIPVLQSTQPFLLSELVAQLINQISATGKKIFLFLDDYHLITAGAVHEVMDFLIEHQPKELHVVVLTREDPPFPLPRLRARGQMTEIRERDLRFTLPEAQSFLTEAMGLALDPEDVGKLKERTEGWVAGMQLAALALEETTSETERRAFIEAFAGSDRYIVDYLISEVLERQPPAARTFLLETAIFDRFCADLCDQVLWAGSEPGRSQAILEGLEQGNMFLVPLDNQRRWYRYHHLFGEMLCHALKLSAPERAAELHRKACGWFEVKGQISEAVKHAAAYALSSGDWALPRALLNRHAMRVLFQGQVSPVIGWCQGFPGAYLEQAPEICIYYAWALVLTFRNDYLDAVEEKLSLAEHALAALELPATAGVGQNGARVPFRDWIVGQICVIRSQILLGRFQTFIDPQELIALSLKGLQLLPEVEKATLAICRINLAHAQTMQGHAREAQQAFEEALPSMLEAQNYLTGVTAIFYQARLAYYLGQLERAEALCRQWKEKFAQMAGAAEREIPALRGLDIVLSLLLMERGQFEEAEDRLGQALDLLGWASWMELSGFILLARLRQRKGDSAGLADTLRRMAGLGPQHASCAEALMHLFWATDPQRRAAVEHWAKTHPPDFQARIIALGIGPYHADAEYLCNLCWAQVQIALGQPQSALAYLVPALQSASQLQLTYRIIELSVVLALAQEAKGDHPAALQALITALELAEPAGYVRVFDRGPSLDRLLGEAARTGAQPAYIERLQAAFQRQPAPEAAEVRFGLVEPISAREREVLRLIAGGLSNHEIGARLYITEGTVKRHITHLYGKLGVQTRTQALAKAREIGLLA